MKNIKLPINFRFKILTIAPKIYVRNGNGQIFAFAQQKLLKLKEQIKIYDNENKNNIKYLIDADRVIDSSAKYHFTNSLNKRIGSVKRNGARSLWRASYEIYNEDENKIYTVRELSVFTLFMNGILESIPVLNIFAGLFFNPVYLILDNSGKEVARLTKKPAIFETDFELTASSDIDIELVTLSMTMMILLERIRG